MLVVGAWSSLRSLPSRDVCPCQTLPPGSSAQRSLTAWCREQGTQSKIAALTPCQPRKTSRVNALIFSIPYLFLLFQEPITKAKVTLKAGPPTLLKSPRKSINAAEYWPGHLRSTAPQNPSSQAEVSADGKPSTTWWCNLNFSSFYQNLVNVLDKQNWFQSILNSN